MATRATLCNSSNLMQVLSSLLLPPRGGSRQEAMDGLTRGLRNLSREQFNQLVALAGSNHVVMRALNVIVGLMYQAQDAERAEWAAQALETEGRRIANALGFLKTICAEFESRGHNVAVIKSLDHWPDLGSDLDLYSDSNADNVCRLMHAAFGAKTAPRSWGDRLAHKWNFILPGLPELVEVHVGRLGQTGEQVAIASGLMTRTRIAEFGGFTFRLTSAADRLMISTLQRMYRHFYFRLCDIVDTAALSETGTIDYEDLRFSSKVAGIWKGVASYLVIVSDYLNHYRGKGLDLPHFVRVSARFGGDELHFNRGFLRIPIMPQSAKLYGSQLTTLLLNRELQNSVRLSLLPCLATAAVVGQKITGSDKGIW